jgi:hypothetical protein
MSNTFISLNRQIPGTRFSDFTTATSSTTGDDIELRVADGASLTRRDVMLALKAFERFFQQFQSTSGIFPTLD